MPSTARLVLRVPLLLERPVIDEGCCAVSAGDIVRDELERLDGVWGVRADESVGLIEVCYETDRLSARDISGALDRIGYPAVDPSEVDGKATQQLPKEANT